LIKETLSLLPFKIQNRLSFLFNNLSELENIFFRTNKIEIDKPIFICGSPRSGTTLLTHVLNQHENVGSFEYQDLPFYKIPILWSKINKIYYGKVKSSPRIHGDNLNVGLDSPDAFEELIWSNYIKEYKKNGFCKYLDTSYDNLNLQTNLNESIKKILFLRKKTRYLSKGNYNIFRLKFILKTFPSAKIIICCRKPIDTSQSLEKVHLKFNDMSKQDPMFKKKLIELCHYEFGPQRKAVLTDKESFDSINNFWKKNDNLNGYLLQWSNIYKMVNENYLENNEINKKFFLLDYDEFIENQDMYLKKILHFCELNNNEELFNQNIQIKRISKTTVNNSMDKDLFEQANLIYKKLKDFIERNY